MTNQQPQQQSAEPDFQRAIKALQELAADAMKRSMTARLRPLLSEIEAAIQAGVKRTEILSALNAAGFNLTLRGLDSSIYRLRKRAKAKEEPTQTAQISAPVPKNPEDKKHTTPNLQASTVADGEKQAGDENRANSTSAQTAPSTTTPGKPNDPAPRLLNDEKSIEASRAIADQFVNQMSNPLISRDGKSS